MNITEGYFEIYVKLSNFEYVVDKGLDRSYEFVGVLMVYDGT